MNARVFFSPCIYQKIEDKRNQLMNKSHLLDLLLFDAEKNEHRYQMQTDTTTELHQILLEDLQNLGGEKVALPDRLPSVPSEAISLLRDLFNDNVSLISRVLNHLFPNQYLFYRFSKLEEEIFLAFDYFSSVVPAFEFAFSKVGRTGFDRYLELNATLLEVFSIIYPELENPQAKIAWFLYEGLGRLFTEKSDYNRYWIMATREENFADLDSGDDLNWSARKEMQPGDLVFIYRTAPRSAITDVFEVQGEPYFEPWAPWDGFWADLSRVCRIDDVTFADLRNDSTLKSWGVVRKQFQGVIVEALPHSVYNRLLERIPGSTRSLHDLEFEPTASMGRSGQFATEADFEDQVIVPLLRRWGLDYQRQYRSHFRFGRQDLPGLVDFLVRDGRGSITLFENKVRILNDKGLKEAAEQGKSYALTLGLPSFVVASPEGLWIYSLDRNRESLEMQISLDELEERDEEARSMLLKLRVP
jgi:EVE domain